MLARKGIFAKPSIAQPRERRGEAIAAEGSRSETPCAYFNTKELSNASALLLVMYWFKIQAKTDTQGRKTLCIRFLHYFKPDHQTTL